MKEILDILKAPWLASSGTSRWITAVAILVVLAVVAPIAKLYRGPGWVVAAAALCAFAIGVLWVLVIPNALWLARDARALRLPAVMRIANASPLAYGLLSVVAPALLLGAVGGHTLLLLGVFALVAAGCLCYLLLPAILASVLVLATLAAGHVHYSTFSHTTIQQLPGWAALACIAFTAWRWLRLSRASSLDSGVWGRPIAWQYRQIRERGYFAAIASAREARRDQVWAWLRPQPDMQRLGPGHPVRAIRMALGRALMPQTVAWYLLQAGVWVTVVALVVGLWLVGGKSPADALALLSSPGFISGICGGGGAAVLVTYVGQVQGRWSNGHAELPLLALLPGLGSPRAARRSTLRACLVKPLAILLVTWLAICAIGILDHAFYPVSLVGSLFVATCIALAVAMVLGTLAGKPISGYAIAGTAIALLVLLGVSLGLGQVPAARVSGWLALVAAAWLALIAWLTLGAWRSWRLFQRRPHPFLANPAG